jgi:hypothetical protein
VFRVTHDSPRYVAVSYRFTPTLTIYWTPSAPQTEYRIGVGGGNFRFINKRSLATSHKVDHVTIHVLAELRSFDWYLLSPFINFLVFFSSRPWLPFIN